jgi:CHASE2 domain-containing sensor protein
MVRLVDMQDHEHARRQHPFDEAQHNPEANEPERRWVPLAWAISMVCFLILCFGALTSEGGVRWGFAVAMLVGAISAGFGLASSLARRSRA